MNGVCCIRFLDNVDAILLSLKNEALKRLTEGDDETMNERCSTEKLNNMFQTYLNVFDTLDLVMSLFRTLAPSEEEIEMTKQAVFVLEKLWTERLKLRITPKAHILFTHAVSLMEKHGGITDKAEDFVEKEHQRGKKLEALTARMPDQCYRTQQLACMSRAFRMTDPRVQSVTQRVHQETARNFQNATSRITKKKQKKEERQIKRESTRNKGFFTDITNTHTNLR